ncbi:MAG: hypothetical protein BHV63_02915 [Alistipes sp. 56_11]|nr:MAG: hypothetical protein BHV63_02915 [Alistipes sp. 56_11]
MGRFQHDSRLSHLGEFGVEHLLHQRQFVRVFLSSGAGDGRREGFFALRRLGKLLLDARRQEQPRKQ